MIFRTHIRVNENETGYLKSQLTLQYFQKTIISFDLKSQNEIYRYGDIKPLILNVH